jgi:hypothetical protein
MIGSRRAIRSRRRVALTAILLGLVGVPTPVAAVERSPSSNRLDHPMADMAVLAPAVTDGPPRLLVVDAIDPSPSGATIRILERARAWESIAETPIDLGMDRLETPWLVGIGPDRFVLIATSESAGMSVVVGLRVVAQAGGRAVAETGRTVIERVVADAGATDVDGDGVAELLLGLAPDDADGCPGSDLHVYDPTSLAVSRAIHLEDRLVSSGVIGPFDALPGDEVLVYAEDVCFDAATTLDNSHLIAVRLLDGQTLLDLPSGPRYPVGAVGPPLRIDLDGVGPDEVVAMTADGLSIVDPQAAWASTPFGSDRAIPLVAGADADASGPATRLVWSEPAGGTIQAHRIRRAADGTIEASSHVAFDATESPDRWTLTRRATMDGADRGEPAAGWLGGAVDAGCPDVIVPAAILTCGAEAFRPGPTWIGTRPLLALGTGAQRSVLIAAGLGWVETGALPPTPSPLALAVAGWWRHGPSVPFALSEIRASDTTYFRDFPVPLASVESTTAPGLTIDVPGFTGTRFFVRARALAPDAETPTETQSALSILASRPDEQSMTTVVRVPVPPGVESGRDGSSVPVDLSRAMLPDGSATSRWAIDLVPLNDWGELGEVASGVVIRDETGPTLNVAVPFTSPVWPAAASLPGSSESGATVVVEGIGVMELDRRGRFAIETTLAPWPQTYRITASDASGNTTVKELSVVGGVDYRRFPWLLIAAVALLGLVTARGMAGQGRAAREIRPSRARWTVGIDDGPRPEIEDLPPGGGLPPR